MAEIIGGLGETKTLKLAHGAAVEAGEVIVVNGNVLVAVNKADASVENVYVYRGRINFPKVGSAIPAATKVYWAAGTSEITTVDTGNTLAGITLEATGASDTMAPVALHEN